MKWKHWTAGGYIVVIFLIYPSCRQKDMVVSWLKPGNDNISRDANWIFGKYSSGRIVHARECLEVANGWDALDSIWPMSFALILVSLYFGVTGGYMLRDNDNAAKHKRELSELEEKYKQRIEGAERNYRQAEIWERSSKSREADTNEKLKEIRYLNQSLTKREQHIVDSADERIQALNKQLHRLQEDHRNRLNKMEGLEKDKLELKRKNNTLERENIRFGEENLTLIKENMALKQGK